jgi:hypothetical protein
MFYSEFKKNFLNYLSYFTSQTVNYQFYLDPDPTTQFMRVYADLDPQPWIYVHILERDKNHEKD